MTALNLHAHPCKLSAKSEEASIYESTYYAQYQSLHVTLCSQCVRVPTIEYKQSDHVHTVGNIKQGKIGIDAVNSQNKVCLNWSLLVLKSPTLLLTWTISFSSKLLQTGFLAATLMGWHSVLYTK